MAIFNFDFTSSPTYSSMTFCVPLPIIMVAHINFNITITSPYTRIITSLHGARMFGAAFARALHKYYSVVFANKKKLVHSRMIILIIVYHIMFHSLDHKLRIIFFLPKPESCKHSSLHSRIS